MSQDRLTRRSLHCLISQGLLISLTASLLVSCIGADPLRVGFAAHLTGTHGELGVQERNGIQLAVEETNAAGGLAGRSVELVVEDDLGTPEGARSADRKLIDAGVVAIISHATSGQSLAGLSVTDPARVVMLSPTTSNLELSGRDGYCFRIVQTMTAQAQHSAQYIYESLGDTMVVQASFSSMAQPDVAPLVAKSHAENPDGLLIIAADIDTALIARRTRLIGWSAPLFTTSWTQTETLIHNGGQAVEGLQLELISALNNQTPKYLEFKAHYQERFGLAPSFGAVLGYEAAGVLAVALQETGGEAEGLRQALVGIKNFERLSDTFSLDENGDAVRPIHLGVIHNGQYIGAES